MAYQVNPTLSGIPDAPLNNSHSNFNNATVSTSFKNITNLQQSIPPPNTYTAAATGASVKATNTQQHQQPSTAVTTASAVHDTKQPIEFPPAFDSGNKSPLTNKSASSLIKTLPPAAVTLQHPLTANNANTSVNATTASNDLIKLTNNNVTIVSPTNSTDVIKTNNNTNNNSTITNTTMISAAVAGKTNLTADKNTTTPASIPVVTVEKVIHPLLRNMSAASSMIPINKNESKNIIAINIPVS